MPQRRPLVARAAVLKRAAQQKGAFAATGDAKRYVVLANPVFLFIGFTNWLFDIEAKRRTTVARADLPGVAYLYVILAVCVIGITVLLLRYRRMEA